MGEQPERRRRRVRPSHSAAAASAEPAASAPGPEALAAADPVSDVDGAVAETAPVQDPAQDPVQGSGDDVPPVRVDPGVLAARGAPPGARKPPRPGPGPGGEVKAGTAEAARGDSGPGRGAATPGGPARGGAAAGGPARNGAGASAPPRGGAGAGGGGDEPAERGLRGLVGSGSSQVSVGAAMRARDAARPTDEQVAAAERELVIVRRNWVPREDLPRGR